MARTCAWLQGYGRKYDLPPEQDEEHKIALAIDETSRTAIASSI